MSVFTILFPVILDNQCMLVVIKFIVNYKLLLISRINKWPKTSNMDLSTLILIHIIKFPRRILNNSIVFTSILVSVMSLNRIITFGMTKKSMIFKCYSSKKRIALNTLHELVPTWYSFRS